MGRRQRVDEETAAVATERLARLLGDLAPRRAAPGAEEEAPDPIDVRPAQRHVAGPDRLAAPAGDRRAATSPPPPLPAVTAPPHVAAPLGSVTGRARDFSRRHLGVLSLLLVIGLAAAGWALLRARPVAVATPLTVSTTASAPASTAQTDQSPTGQTSTGQTSTGQTSTGQTSTGQTSTGQPSTGQTRKREAGDARSADDRASPAAGRPATILVHVVGAVRKPGVVSLPERARVQDAVEAAGGLAAGARPGQLNLAQVLQDGQQVVIGSARAPDSEVRDSSTPNGAGGGSAGTAGSGSVSPSTVMVDLNTATLTQLDSLPGVGPVTAERILGWRTEHGRFSRIEELQEVDGIGPKTYARIAPHVRV